MRFNNWYWVMWAVYKRCVRVTHLCAYMCYCCYYLLLPATTCYFQRLPDHSWYYMLLPVTTWYYLILPATTYYFQLLPLTTCYYLLIADTTCYYLLLPVTTCYYLFIPDTTCYYLLIPDTTCYYLLLLLLPATTCYYLLIPATTCYYQLLPTTTCYYLLPPATTCYFRDMFRIYPASNKIQSVNPAAAAAGSYWNQTTSHHTNKTGSQRARAVGGWARLPSVGLLAGRVGFRALGLLELLVLVELERVLSGEVSYQSIYHLR